VSSEGHGCLSLFVTGFQRLYEYTKLDAKCRLCQLLVEHRKAPRQYTMCYANSTWQEASKKAVAQAAVHFTAQPMFMQQQQQQGQVPQQPKAQQQQQDVLITMVNRHFWAKYFGHNWTEPCSYDSQPLTCRYVNIHSSNNNMTADTRQQVASRADALVYHICPDGPRPEGVRPNVPTVAMTIESPSNHLCMNQPEVMRHADIDMSYRRCAQVGVIQDNSNSSERAVHGW